jgi:hypothetical protein
MMGILTPQLVCNKKRGKMPEMHRKGRENMTPPLCDMDCDCEDCGDRQACDIYFKEIGFQLLQAKYEEDWHEKRFAEKEGL